MWVPVWEYNLQQRLPEAVLLHGAGRRQPGRLRTGYTGISGVMQWVRSSIFMCVPPLRPGVQPDHQGGDVRRGHPGDAAGLPQIQRPHRRQLLRASSRSP